MSTMINATQVVTDVTFTLQGFAAQRLLQILDDESYSDGSIHDDTYGQLERLKQELADLFGTVSKAAPEPEPKGHPPIVLEIPRSYAWNVFTLRSHVYKYVKSQFGEALTRPEDIKISYAANQEALS